jgi:hypothetical protein
VADNPPIEPGPPDEDRPTAAPFLGALAIIVIVVIGIWAFNVFGDDGPTPEQEVGRAAVGQNDALQRQNYPDYRLFTCKAQQSTEPDVMARQRDSVAKNGDRYVDGASDVRVDGDRATAKVNYHYDNDAENSFGVDVAFVREDGTWKVCSPASS